LYFRCGGWVNKDCVDEIEQLQISRHEMLTNAYQSRRTGLPTVEKALLTQGGRDDTRLRQIEGTPALISACETG